MAMEVKQVLHMKEGTDETSYMKASYIPKQVLSLTKSIKEKAIEEFYCKEQPTTLCIADLGCSSAYLNSLGIVSVLIETIEKARRELGIEYQEYQVYLNDLPGNDFNTIFRSLPTFEDNLKLQMEDDSGYCFVNGVPGSFYGRLFPTNHLHFVHSSYSLMWLSQVPKGINNNNKGNIYIGKKTPPNVLTAYYEQFKKDFTTFLKCRSEEVVAGGMMVLTILGRQGDEQHSKDSCHEWELLATALNDMVLEGLIEEEKLDTFNIPQYTPSTTELCSIVKNQGSFSVNQVDVSQLSWEANEHDNNEDLCQAIHQNHHEFSNCMRSVAEPLLISHFGLEIMDDLFKRYNKIIQVTMAKEKNVFTNVTILLTRKG